MAPEQHQPEFSVKKGFFIPLDEELRGYEDGYYTPGTYPEAANYTNGAQRDLLSLGLPAFASPLTTKGDIFGFDTVDQRVAVGTNGEFLKVDSAQSTGLDWDTIGGFGKAIYGDGADGALTLSANTTFADNAFIKRYTNVTLAGFTLTAHSSDNTCIIYVKDTLSLGGGTIHQDAKAAGGGGGGGNGSGGTGDGGDGGGGGGTLYVLAKTITGTGVISAKGTNGGNATIAVPPGGGGGTGGSGVSADIVTFGTSVATGTATGGATVTAGAAPRAGSAGGTGSSVTTAWHVITSHNLLALLGAHGRHTATFEPLIEHLGQGGSGGTGACGFALGPSSAPGGGGGAGGTSFGQTSGGGGNGSAGGSTTTDNLDVVGGAGGGGGGGGGLVVVITESAPSTLTVSASGGAGGNGSQGSHDDSGGSGLGGKGGGGAGGIAVLVAQTGSGATVTAAGGAAGAIGNGTATSGANGIAMNLVRS